MKSKIIPKNHSNFAVLFILKVFIVVLVVSKNGFISVREHKICLHFRGSHTAFTMFPVRETSLHVLFIFCDLFTYAWETNVLHLVDVCTISCKRAWIRLETHPDHLLFLYFSAKVLNEPLSTSSKKTM